jgi:hypothetical protein
MRGGGGRAEVQKWGRGRPESKWRRANELEKGLKYPKSTRKRKKGGGRKWKKGGVQKEVPKLILVENTCFCDLWLEVSWPNWHFIVHRGGIDLRNFAMRSQKVTKRSLFQKFWVAELNRGPCFWKSRNGTFSWFYFVNLLKMSPTP